MSRLPGIRLLGVLAEIRTGDFPSTNYRLTARGKLLDVENTSSVSGSNVLDTR
jgi:hypothetical protein